MVTSIPQAFEQLRRNVELTGLQKPTVASRQQSVRAALDKSLEVNGDFLTGSYIRQTLIGPLAKADVDIFTVLDHQYADRGPRNVLEMVRCALLKTYPKTPAISRNGQAITVTFSDFAVDVVPAFKLRWWENSGWGEQYRICNSGSDTWIQTNPKMHTEISSAANKRHGGLLIPCIKQLKAWNRAVNKPLRSFHIEVLAWEIFGRSAGLFFHHKMGNDWENARFFFDKVREELKQRQADPAGTGVDVGAYLSGQKLDTAVSKANSAYRRCLRAEREVQEGRPGAAHDAYRQIFGDYYPATK